MEEFYILIPFSRGEEITVRKNLQILQAEKKIKIFLVGPHPLEGKVRFIKEKKRMGKSYWIKKILLSHKKGVLVLISGDVRIRSNFLMEVRKKIGIVFQDPGVA